MKYKLAIFDLDGTILDTLGDLAAAVNHAQRNAGLPVSTPEEVRRFLGKGARYLVSGCCPSAEGELLESLIADFASYYQDHSMDLTRPYEGMPELVDTLRENGCRSVVLSNKLDPAVKPLTDHYYPGKFDMSYGERPPIPRKPAPDATLSILREMNVAPEHAVYIGDSEVDLATGLNAGLDTICVDWGFRTHEELVEDGAPCIVSTPQELLEALLG